jgi:hypothetical protein
MPDFSGLYNLVVPKMQSYDSDSKTNRDLEAIFKFLQIFFDQSKLVAQNVDGTGGSNDNGTGNDGGTGGSGGSGSTTLSLAYETPTLLVDQSTGVQNSWTTINSGVTSTYAIIQFRLHGDSDSDGIIMNFRKTSGSPEIPTLQVIKSSDSGEVALITWYFVELNNGLFDYDIVVTNGTPDWSIYRIGSM